MKIIEDIKKGIVTINGYSFNGYIHQSKCDKCEHFLVMHEDYDAYFCPRCNEWNEKKCGDPECHYCSNRSEKPMQSFV